MNTSVWAITGAKAVLWVLVLTRMTGLLATLPLLGSDFVSGVLGSGGLSCSIPILAS